MKPAGINFPDFLNLIPITSAREPEATEMARVLEKIEYHAHISIYGNSKHDQNYLHSETATSLGSFDTL